MPHAEWGLNGCIFCHAHQFLMFHSAVVEKDLDGLPSWRAAGLGKKYASALLLLARGWRLLSDEFALLDPARGWLPADTPTGRRSRAPLSSWSEKLLPRMPDQARVFAYTRKGTLAHLRPPTDARRAASGTGAAGLGGCFRHIAASAETRLAAITQGRRISAPRGELFLTTDELGRTAVRCVEPTDRRSGVLRAAFCAGCARAAELVDGLAAPQPVADLPLDAA